MLPRANGTRCCQSPGSPAPSPASETFKHGSVPHFDRQLGSGYGPFVRGSPVSGLTTSVFPRALISALRCPGCGSQLAVSVEVRSSAAGLTDGILQCDCYEYPVVG